MEKTKNTIYISKGKLGKRCEKCGSQREDNNREYLRKRSMDILISNQHKELILKSRGQQNNKTIELGCELKKKYENGQSLIHIKEMKITCEPEIMPRERLNKRTNQKETIDRIVPSVTVTLIKG